MASCFLIKYFFRVLHFFTNIFFQPVPHSQAFNLCEVSHLSCYLVSVNLYSKHYALTLLLSGLIWFFFAFFWSLPTQFSLLTALLSLFYTIFLHIKIDLVYFVLIFSLLPKGTHTYDLIPFELSNTLLFLIMFTTVFLKSFSLRQYAGVFFFLFGLTKF